VRDKGRTFRRGGSRDAANRSADDMRARSDVQYRAPLAIHTGNIRPHP
jgi:hypothetical protein